MTQNKTHWYDGWFYDKLIAPNQDRLFSEIKKIIPAGSTVLDLGCGTGRFAITMANHCSQILSVDLSEKNIQLAKTNAKDFTNLEFRHLNALSLKVERKFDYAVITYVIHEMPPGERALLIKHLKTVADKIIIGDYIFPQPRTLWGKINTIVEFLAGRDHFANFKDYLNNGGLYEIIKETNSPVLLEVKNKPNSAHIVMVE